MMYSGTNKVRLNKNMHP